jgi:hypothetical protein
MGDFWGDFCINTKRAKLVSLSDKAIIALFIT